MNCLLYRKLKGGWYVSLNHKMTGLQELENFGIDNSGVRITYSYWKKGTTTLDHNHEKSQI